MVVTSTLFKPGFCDVAAALGHQRTRIGPAFDQSGACTLQGIGLLQPFFRVLLDILYSDVGKFYLMN